MHVILLLSSMASSLSLSKTMFRIDLMPFIVLFLFFKSVILEDLHWDYQRNGPDTWPHRYDTCNGDAQSPIDIRSKNLHYNPNFRPLSLNGYTGNNSLYLWNISHNGHTIVAYPPILARLSIDGADLTEEFYLDHFHFHWGYNIYQGSEHTINGMKYPLEIHFIHQNRFRRTSAVLSVIFKLRYEENLQLNEFLSIINETIDTSISIQRELNLSRLFSTFSSSPRFYRYNGSLTNPPCTEGIIWIILARFIPISSSQLEVFNKNSIPTNFRFTQRLYSRIVSSNFQPEFYDDTYDEENQYSHHSSASSHSIDLFFFVFIVILL